MLRQKHLFSRFIVNPHRPMEFYLGEVRLLGGIQTINHHHGEITTFHTNNHHPSVLLLPLDLAHLTHRQHLPRLTPILRRNVIRDGITKHHNMMDSLHIPFSCFFSVSICCFLSGYLRYPNICCLLRFSASLHPLHTVPIAFYR